MVCCEGGKERTESPNRLRGCVGQNQITDSWLRPTDPSLHDWVRNSAFPGLYLLSLYPEIMRSLLKWLEHLVRMLPAQPLTCGGLITTGPARGEGREVVP